MATKAAGGMRQRQKIFAQDLVLDAAERLLERGDIADFSMRELAVEAQVGFATPFNYFGNKTTIMQALSQRIIARIAENYAKARPTGDAIDRVLAMSRIGAETMLENSRVSRAVLASLSIAPACQSTVRMRSKKLWQDALGDFAGIQQDLLPLVQTALPDQLAFAYRGCLSFWIAEDLTDDTLLPATDAASALSMLGVVDAARRPMLLECIDRSESLL